MDYTPELENEIQDWLREQITPQRLDHVVGVVEAATELAERYAPGEVERCRIAGWLHDAAKHWSGEDLLAYAEARGELITPMEREVPMLLHGLVGYLVGAEQFALDDPLIKAACTNHTTSAPGMGIVEKIVFLADLIEPERRFDGVETIRKLADNNLDQAMLFTLDHSLRYLIDRKRLIDPRPLLLRNELLQASVMYDLSEVEA